MAVERRPTPVKAEGEWQFPVGAPSKELAMHASIGEGLQCVERFPDRQVDDHQRIVEDPDVGGIAGVM